MKIVNCEIETPFVFNGLINTLIVENSTMFRKCFEDMANQVDGGCGNFVLSDGDEILSIDRKIHFIYDYTLFRLDDKKYVNKLYNNLSAIVEEKFLSETTDLFEKFNNWFNSLNAECEIPLDYDCDTPIISILKSFNIKPAFDSDDFLERLIEYIEGIRYFTKKNIFCFLNLKSFLSLNELITFYDYVIKNDIHVLQLESFQKEKTTREFTVVIDNDLCEFHL